MDWTAFGTVFSFLSSFSDFCNVFSGLPITRAGKQ